MQRKLVEKLCCPFDKNDLDINVFHEDEQGEIYEGLLTCTHCKRYFPVIYGIPIMTPDAYRQKSLEAPMLKKWGLEITAEEKTFVFEDPKGSEAIRE